jgi:D-glycero-alpha-D-manno-heptose 1-phosphate guanylyltransferase
MSGVDGVTALILAGGRGTRIHELYPNTPKPLIPIAGQPFLYWLTRWIHQHGVNKFIYSAGYLADQIEDWTQNDSFPSLSRTVRKEERPLGTGGALLHGLDRSAEWSLVANGDGLVMGGIDALLDQRFQTVDGALIGIEVADAARYGSLETDADGRLLAFREKVSGSGLINGGLYLLRTELFSNQFTATPQSLERDIFPSLISGGARISVVNAGSAPFIDIGTPDSLKEAEGFVRRHFELET